jgi:hypothetical protein
VDVTEETGAKVAGVNGPEMAKATGVLAHVKKAQVRLGIMRDKCRVVASSRGLFKEASAGSLHEVTCREAYRQRFSRNHS